ncbi:MAG: dolichyl-phosphate-mannose--protein mannosyltransferase [Tannerella sp.]|jgi:4-amino-4-deoxy-L-arabinose transferase-like glycosyltransferase|nr:dolichyl-phosphate-mannose--protein mannosyltransferase [Tannerella sp.]
MRTTALQYLYLQKPVSTMLLVALLAVLPWIAAGDFSTKGEPREATVAVSMLESGNWMLPRVYADEFAYKPPLTHWLMALFSLPQGHVSPFTARLPSALAYTALLTASLLFFGRKVRFQEAFIATLLLFTCVEIHRAGMTARVDMLLTFFTVAGLMRLFWWENERELKGLPVVIPLLLSGAFLTKGPVGLILPVFVFGVYLLLLRKYSLFKIGKSLLYIGVASLFLPSLWYIEAWRTGGDDFLNVVLAENFGRFFHLSPGNIHYNLGHENGAWYNLVTLAAGFLPWTLLLFFSLFGLKTGKLGVPLKGWLARLWLRIRTMDRIGLFSLTASVCIVFFYSLPSSKRSVYLMPAYPFIALFIARYLLYLAEYRSKVTRLYAGVLAALVATVALVAVFQMTGLVDIRSIAGRHVSSAATSATLDAVVRSLSPGIPMALTGTLLLASLFTAVYQMRKKINIKILYATFFLVFSTHLFIDGVVMKNVRKEGSARPFAEEIRRTYGLDKTNVYVMNDLHAYHNMYGLNFYLGNCFRNFETEQPQAGFFLASERDAPSLTQRYGEEYAFQTLLISDNIIGDVRGRIVLSRFIRK